MAPLPPLRGRILVVDDHPDVRETLVMLLDYLGLQVIGAANGQEALDQLQQPPLPDLILLDLMMPVMSGPEFRRRQQQDAALATIPVVVISAISDRLPDGVALDPVAYLKKPVDFQELFALLAQVLPTSAAP